MKKVIFILAFLATIGVTSAAVQLLPNTGFESYGDDGYGRIMPTDGWGLWTPDTNWGNIPNVEVKTLSGDGIAAYDGDASFMMDTTASGGDVALFYGFGQLGNNIGLGYYNIQAWIKGTVGTGANIGVDIFSADYGQTWYSGGTPITTVGEWTLFQYDLNVDSTVANYNIRIKSAPGSDFQIDNMMLFTDVPEPATMALLGLGTLLLRRKK